MAHLRTQKLMQFFFQRGALLTEREIKFQSCISLLNKIHLVNFNLNLVIAAYA